MSFDFFITSMPASRQADYYLGCLDSSVYLDFNDRGGQVTLRRISFDGYGCCEPKQNLRPLPADDADSFLSMMHTEKIDQAALSLIVKKALTNNQKHLWLDALKQYGFI